MFFDSQKYKGKCSISPPHFKSEKNNTNLPKKIKVFILNTFHLEKWSTSFFSLNNTFYFDDTRYAIFRPHSSRKSHTQWSIKQKFNSLLRNFLPKYPSLIRMIPFYLHYSSVSNLKINKYKCFPQLFLKCFCFPSFVLTLGSKFI